MCSRKSSGFVLDCNSSGIVFLGKSLLLGFEETDAGTLFIELGVQFLEGSSVLLPRGYHFFLLCHIRFKLCIRRDQLPRNASQHRLIIPGRCLGGFQSLAVASNRGGSFALYSRELLLCVNHFLCDLRLHSGILLRRCSNSLHSLDSLLSRLRLHSGCLLGRSCGSLHCCLLLDRGYLCGLCHIGRFRLHRNAVALCSFLCRCGRA